MELATTNFIEKSLDIYKSMQLTGASMTGSRKHGDGNGKHSPLNLAHGMLGESYFILELYKNLPGKSIHEDLLKRVDYLEKYRLANKTNNYGLFYGRSGLSYFYLQLYQVTRNAEYLEMAAGIGREYLDAGSGHLKINDNNGMLNGTAGILLWYLHLYHHTNEPQFLEVIEQYLLLLTGRACLSRNGIYWDDADNKNNAHTGWAFGATGIAFCMLELARFFNNEALGQLAQRALNYDGEYISGKNFNEIFTALGREDLKTTGTDDFGDTWLSKGAIGHELVKLYAARRLQYSEPENDWKELAVSISWFLSSRHKNRMPHNLLTGFAGWGLAFTDAYSLTMNQDYLGISNRIAHIICENIDETKAVKSKDPGLFYGLPGVGYFLLKCADSNPSLSLLLPGIASGHGNSGNGRMLHRANLNLTQPRINELLVKKNFKETLRILKRDFSAAIEDYLALQEHIAPERFFEWVSNLCGQQEQHEYASILQETAEREAAAVRVKIDLYGSPPDDDLRFVQLLDSIMQWTEPEFRKLVFTVSQKITILRREEIIDLSVPLTPQSLSVLFTTYGHGSFFLRLNRYNDVESGKLGILRLYVDQFIQPASVETVIQRICDFIMRQEESILSLLMQELKAGSPGILRERIDTMVLNATRDLVMLSLLEPLPEQPAQS